LVARYLQCAVDGFAPAAVYAHGVSIGIDVARGAQLHALPKTPCGGANVHLASEHAQAAAWRMAAARHEVELDLP